MKKNKTVISFSDSKAVAQDVGIGTSFVKTYKIDLLQQHRQ